MRGIKKQYPDPYRRQGSNSYYFVYIDGKTGKRVYRSTKTKTKAVAIKRIKIFMDDLEDRDTPQSGMRFSDYAIPFFVDGTCPRQARLKAEGKSFGLKHLYDSRNALDRVVGRDDPDRPSFSHLPFADLILDQITRDDIYELRTTLSRIHSGGRMGQQVFKAVKTVLDEAEKRGHIERSPADGITPYSRSSSSAESPEEKRGYLTADELASLWKVRHVITAPSRSLSGLENHPHVHEVSLVLLFGLGLRVSEVLAIRWKDIDFESCSFDVAQALKGGLKKNTHFEKPKWGKQRLGLKLPKTVLICLKHYFDHRKELDHTLVADDSLIISNVDGTPVTSAFIRKLGDRVYERASSPKFNIIPKNDPRHLTPHSSRHTLAFLLIEKEISDVKIERFLGWNQHTEHVLSKMIQRYGHIDMISTEMVAEAIDELLEPDNFPTLTHDN